MIVELEICDYCHRHYRVRNGHVCAAAQAGNRRPKKEKPRYIKDKVRKPQNYDFSSML